jgi:hypothetical protein
VYRGLPLAAVAAGFYLVDRDILFRRARAPAGSLAALRI